MAKRIFIEMYKKYRQLSTNAFILHPISKHYQCSRILQVVCNSSELGDQATTRIQSHKPWTKWPFPMSTSGWTKIYRSHSTENKLCSVRTIHQLQGCGCFNNNYPCLTNPFSILYIKQASASTSPEALSTVTNTDNLNKSNKQTYVLKHFKKSPNRGEKIEKSYTTMSSTVNQFILMRYFAVNQPLMQYTFQTWQCHVLIYALTTLIY